MIPRPATPTKPDTGSEGERCEPDERYWEVGATSGKQVERGVVFNVTLWAEGPPHDRPGYGERLYPASKIESLQQQLQAAERENELREAELRHYRECELVVGGDFTKLVDLVREERDEERDKREAAEKRAERRGEALERFVHPIATTRSPVDDGPPERYVLRVEVTVADWMRASALLGKIDAEYLRALPPLARPSDEFIAEIAALTDSEEEG